METKVDVLVVGAGPVGLHLAGALCRAGVSVALVDAMTERSFFCKALGITARTLEIFDDFGIAQDAIDAGVWLTAMAVFTDGTPGPVMTIPEDLPFGSLSLAQIETERLLETNLRRHGGHVEYGSTLADFVQADDGVTATLVRADGSSRTIACRWLVGCDGAHSKVRATLGLGFDGGRYPQTFVLADVDVDWDLPRGPAYRFIHSAAGDRPAATLVAIPVAGSPRRYRLSRALPDGAEEAEAAARSPGPEEIDALMTPLLPAGARLSGQRWSSLYRISHRIVPHYGSGRVFVAGDAAHIHPPVGGQGMNTGLQDAYNLAWKLALACDGRAAPGLLDSYSEERRAVGLDVVESTSRALNEALAQKVPVAGMRETQLLVSYRGSSIVSADGGDRIPDVGGLRRARVGQPFRLHERLGRGRHVLFGLVDSDAGAATLAAGMAQLRAAVGDAASGFALVPQGIDLAPREDIPVLQDAAGSFAATFAAPAGTSWLARPDGHVGWTGRGITGLDAALRLIAATPGG